MSVDELAGDAFGKTVASWRAHCKKQSFSSNPTDYISCDAYRDIVGMGEQVLPLIREMYAGKDEDAFFPIFGWASAIREITGRSVEIPDSAAGNVNIMRTLHIEFLDHYLADQYR